MPSTIGGKGKRRMGEDERQEHGAAPGNDLVTVGRAYGPLEWTLAVSMLRAAGLQIGTRGDAIASVSWDKMIAWGGVALQVPASQASDAAGLLTAFYPVRKRRGVERLLIAVAVFLLFQVPPPPSGFYPVRAAVTRQSAPDPA